jgi:hypothetical protein
MKKNGLSEKRLLRMRVSKRRKWRKRMTM